MLSRRLMLVALIVCACGLGQSVRADEPVQLRYKPAKGDKQLFHVKQEMTQKQTIMDIKLENTMTMEAWITRTVEDIDDKGRAVLKTKGERRKVKASLGAAGKFEFDSKSTERDTGSELGAALTPLFERLTGSEYQVFLTPRGEVAEVKGYAELIADVVKDNPLAAQFGGGSNAAAQISEQDFFVILKDEAVKPGDKWDSPYDVELPGIGKVKGKIIHTYDGPDKVGGQATAKISENNESSLDLKLEMGGTKVSGTLSTNGSSGTIQFDPKTGRLVSSKKSFTLSGQLSVDVNGMIIPVQNEQTHTVALEVVDKLPD